MVLDAPRTIYLPLTGNPVGFHHLLLAECALRQFDSLEQVVFLLSNGQHPDPTKRQRILEKQLRLQILEQSLQDWGQPTTSYPARLLSRQGDVPRLSAQKARVSTIEFSHQRPFRLAEHVLEIRAEQIHPEPVLLLVGADLVERMANPDIFSDEDLHTLATNAQILAVPRGETDLPEALEALKRQRGVVIPSELLNLQLIPDPLHPLLGLSSTLIRRAVQAGHTLSRFLPDSAGRLISERQFYRREGTDLFLNEWEMHCRQLEEQLERQAEEVKRLLDERAAQGKSHLLALVETSTGGRIASALTTVTGVSLHFLGSNVAYSHEEKERLLGRSTRGESSVTPKMAQDLVLALQQSTQADWALAETGMAGPSSPERRSRKNGLCHLALSVEGVIYHKTLHISPFLSRKEHQLTFSLEGVTWLREVLQEHSPSATTL